MQQDNRLLEVYDHIKSILMVENINVSDYQLIDYGLQFNVSILSWSGKIRIYQNKKGSMKIDYSQLKGGEHAAKIQSLLEGKRSPESTIPDKKGFELGFPIIGTDESGKGDYFGPLVSAGVYVNEATAKDLIAHGVRDSKAIADSKILELSREIIKITHGRFSIIEISPERYNDLYDQFIKEKKNLNTLLAWGHAKALEEILSKVDCRVAIADQFADEKFILSKLQEKGKKLNLIQMHKAEQNIAVAAASVLARARFLEKLHRLSDEYKIDLPKGVSRKVIDNAKKIVEMYGKDTLRKVAKLHFKTTTEVFN
ncbi:MAG: ribonuclease HIII [Syntrophaceae bacterium]